MAQAPRDEVVNYYQLTLGPAHFARILALGRQPGIRCRGVSLARNERDRAYEEPNDPALELHWLTEGVYEDNDKREVIEAARAQILKTKPSVLIIDSPADSAQYRVGRWAQRRGILVLTRWPSTRLDKQRRWWREFMKGFIYRRWDGYLVTGERAGDYLADFRVPRDRMFVCGNPSDDREIESHRRTCGAIEREDHFLFVGRFVPSKNLTRFLTAFGQYRRDGGTMGLRLAGFGETEPELRTLAANIPGTRFIGHLQLADLVPEYLACAALVLPSSAEPWGLVVNEAMHTGTPVLVSTHAGCVPELVHDGETGLLFDPLNEASMTAALHRFEALSPAEREAMSHAGLRTIANFTADRWATCVAGAIRALRQG